MGTFLNHTKAVWGLVKNFWGNQGYRGPPKTTWGLAKATTNTPHPNKLLWGAVQPQKF